MAGTASQLDEPSHGQERPAAETGTDTGAAPADAVECPECGGPSTAPALERWGNCRACRTAQSRLTNPLRW